MPPPLDDPLRRFQDASPHGTGNPAELTASESASLPWWFAPATFALVLLAYAPALHAGFIWDDDAHLTRPALRSLAGLWRIWTEPSATQQYYPILHSLFWIEHRLWGNVPHGYHAANLVFHIGAVILFGLVLRRLLVPGALLASLVFALHPVHVESVAWISEQKNTLSALFYLGAALAYLRYDARRKSSDYWIASACFVLGLLTKTVVATLPAALLVVIWWRRGGTGWLGHIRPLTPWFVLGAAAGLFTAFVERTLIGAEGAAFDLSLGQRVVLAGRAIWFYLSKLAWPENLTFFYPRWQLEPSSVVQWLPLAGTILLAAVLWIERARSRAPLAAFLLFVGSLLPVLGFLNVYPFLYSFVADHFQYLASLSIIALATAGGCKLLLHHPLARTCLAAAVLTTLGVLTWRQTHDYHDRVTLFRSVLARNPDSWIAHNNLGKELLGDKAQLAVALEHFERALALRPEYAEALNNLGLALTQLGRPAEAIPYLERSVRIQRNSYQAFNNLGIALASSSRPAEALTAFQQAARLNPGLPNIHENWGKALLLLNRRDEATERFAIAQRLRAAASTPNPPTSPPTPR